MHINCAISLDGLLAGPSGKQYRFSCETDMQRVHELRALSDAILVGVNTILTDDPALMVKPEFAEGSHPLRVILDTRCRAPESANIFDGQAETLVLHDENVEPRHHSDMHHGLPMQNGAIELPAVLAYLQQIGVRRLMVEGGATVITNFVSQGLADLFTVYQAPIVMGEGPRLWKGVPRRLRLDEVRPLGKGALWQFSRVTQ